MQVGKYCAFRKKYLPVDFFRKFSQHCSFLGGRNLAYSVWQSIETYKSICHHPFGTFHLVEEEIGDHFSSEEKCQIQVTKFYFQSIYTLSPFLIYYCQNIGDYLEPDHLLSLSIYLWKIATSGTSIRKLPSIFAKSNFL